MLGATHALANPLTARYSIAARPGDRFDAAARGAFQRGRGEPVGIASWSNRVPAQRQTARPPRSPKIWPSSCGAGHAKPACPRGCRIAASSANGCASWRPPRPAQWTGGFNPRTVTEAELLELYRGGVLRYERRSEIDLSTCQQRRSECDSCGNRFASIAPGCVVLRAQAASRRIRARHDHRRGRGRWHDGNAARGRTSRHDHAGRDWPVFRGNAPGDRRGPPPTARRSRRCSGNSSRSRTACSSRRPPSSTAWSTSAGSTATFYALDLATGKEKWKFHSELGFHASAAVRDGLVYIGDTEGRFIASTPPPAKRNGAFTTDAEINAGANFYKDNVLFGSQDGTLYCLERQDRQRSLEVLDRQHDPVLADRSSRIASSWPVATACCTSSNCRQRAASRAGRHRDPDRRHAGGRRRPGLFRHAGRHVLLRSTGANAKSRLVYEHAKHKKSSARRPCSPRQVIGGRDTRCMHVDHASRTGDEALDVSHRSRMSMRRPVIVGRPRLRRVGRRSDLWPESGLGRESMGV